MGKRQHFVPKNEAEKRFSSHFKELAGERNPWSIWSDLMKMVAFAIANSVDQRKDVLEAREKEYLQAIGKYTTSEQKLFPTLFSDIVLALDENPEQDFLGDLYMRLEFGDDWRAQVFTPWHVAEMMARITLGNTEELRREIRERGYLSVFDPCCGAGVMLMASACALKNEGINYQKQVLFVGQDIDPLVAKMCYIQLSLLGCPGYVAIGDSLAKPVLGSITNPIYDPKRIFYTPFFIMGMWDVLPPRGTGPQTLKPAKRTLPAIRPMPGTSAAAMQAVIQEILSTRRRL